MQTDLFEGMRRRDVGVALVDQVEPEHWKVSADLAIGLLAFSGKPFTSEDVRAIAGDPAHPNAMGARFMAAARAGVIECIGVRLASRPSAHARRLGTWRGVS